MSDKNFLFIDSGCLLSDIERVKREFSIPGNYVLDSRKFQRHFTGDKYLMYLGNGYRRIVFYAAAGEDRLKRCVMLPEFGTANMHEDLVVKYCGKKISKSQRIDRWLEENDVPNYVLDRLNKTEKAVDTQICCDAMLLAFHNALDRLFIYTNDTDFIPLIESLKSMGVSVNLFQLVQSGVNSDLTTICNAYMAPSLDELKNMFIGNPN
ncbi:MAG: NYN domain-containing protein [Microcoleaceae cyanobacterium]